MAKFSGRKGSKQLCPKCIKKCVRLVIDPTVLSTKTVYSFPQDYCCETCEKKMWDLMASPLSDKEFEVLIDNNLNNDYYC